MITMIDLLEGIDKEASKNKAKALLNQYHEIKRLAHAPAMGVRANQLSLEPKAKNHAPQDERLARLIEKKTWAKTSLEYIEATLDYLPSEMSQRLKDHYIVAPASLYPVKIFYDKNHESPDTYYRKLNIAVCMFAEAYPTGELLVFKT